ncbi:MAG TPA: regulatory iron-sulfur-containing complex subunit RicT [Bacteroidales bacterium]|nr:regulatory iron-sulfur-containing complex subunit RicT [Bacteroidales bacterium]
MVNEDIQAHTGEEPSEPAIKYKRGANKLDEFNWLAGLPYDPRYNEVVEVRFKNTRKGFYRNVNELRLEVGDIVAVEASPGHDIGHVSMTGFLVLEQIKKMKVKPVIEEMKKVYRKARTVDLQKWEEARKQEVHTMLRSRKIAEDIGLAMKIGDVEYQGDKTKAIFYYLADERVDFRQLIKLLAEEFHIRIEMRQIGARQEAGRIGGIGTCGRELCCSTHVTNFVSVTTSHARYQDLSLNPQKLAGQCGKLKCCLNYELDCYIDAQKDFPPREIPLELANGTAYFMKMEVHTGIYWYSSDQRMAVNLTAVPVARVREIIQLNRKGIKPDSLLTGAGANAPEKGNDLLLQNSGLTRFETKSNPRQPRGRRRPYNKKNEGTRK